MVKLEVTLCLGDETLLIDEVVCSATLKLFKNNASSRELNTRSFTFPEDTLSDLLTEAGTRGFSSPLTPPGAR